MTEPKKYTCATCEGPGFYMPPRPGDWTSHGEFLHNGEADHPFAVKPQCPKCDSFNYEHYETNWGNGSRCHDCGYDIYFSLGD